MGLKRNKTMAQKDFNKEIADIFTEAASLASQQNQPAPVIQQPKPLKPAVVFHMDTCPDQKKLKGKIDDEDYQVNLSMLVPGKDRNFERMYHPVLTYSDICINYAFSVGMDPQFRSLVEKYQNRDAANSIMDIRRIASVGINNKFNFAYTQMIQHGLGSVISSLIGLLNDHGYDKCADALEDTFTFNTDSNYAVRNSGMHIDVDGYIHMIGSTRREESELSYDDACLFIYNSIVDSAFTCSQRDISKYMDEITMILSSPVGPNSPDLMVDVNNTMTEIFSHLSKTIFDNALAVLNDIIFASDALYGNAEINGYFSEF